MQIIKLDRDLRLDEDNKEIVICSPCGDKKTFENFVKMMHRLDISMDVNIDFLFVSPPDLDLSPMKTTLSAIYYKENIVKLGTSGSFFACQVAAYQLGYKIIIMTDIDVEMDDAKVLYDCIRLAKQTGKIVMPQCRARTTSDDTVSSSVWGFGTFPRAMIDKYGFCTPYFHRGAEDYEYNCKVAPDKIEYKNGFIYHPRVGNIFYTKAEFPKKFYPYMGALMKCFLLQGKYLHYVGWYMYNSFLSNIFNDIQLRYVLQTSNQFGNLWQNLTNNNRLFVIRKIKEGAATKGKVGTILSVFKSLPLFLLGKYVDYYTDRIFYVGNKMNLLKGILLAILKLPIEAIVAISLVGEWHEYYKGRLPYPIYPHNVGSAEAWILENFPKQA